MNWPIVKNDLKRNKGIHIALFLFMMISACLAILSVITAVQTFTSINSLYDKAQPPHFLQMHKGELNEEEIKTFAQSYEGVTDWQVSRMIDIYGDNLILVQNGKQRKLSDCRIDLGLVKQNASKDLLLDKNQQPVILKAGQIAMPVLLKEEYDLAIGDHVILNWGDITEEYVITEFVLDAMMNSTMCSSIRILLSDEDFTKLCGVAGEDEYLIEAYFTDSGMAAGFQSAYENAGLPQNGQAITYTMMFLLSAMTDIVTVFVLLLASLLLTLVAFLCVRFTIMAAMQEEIGEIGTMKAIGLPFKEIQNIYACKYRILALAGCITGYILALPLSSVVTGHISQTFGSVSLSVLAIVLSLAAGVLMYLFINHYCKGVLKKLKRVTVVDALVTQTAFNKKSKASKHGLYRSKRMNVNWLLSLRETWHQWREWTIVFVILFLAVVMIMVPFNLRNTLQSPKFVSYMGSARHDIMIEIELSAQMEQSYQNTVQLLNASNQIKNMYEYRRVSVQTTDIEGNNTNLHIDCGLAAGEQLQYLSGRAPVTEQEIALSYLNSELTGKTSGDTILLSFDGSNQEYVVSGVYQDVTSGGYTAKAIDEFLSLPAEKYSFTIDLTDAALVKEIANQWSEQLGGSVTVDPMEEFLNQTLGGVTRQLASVVAIICLLGCGLVVLITILFLKLRIAKDMSKNAVMNALGFTKSDIRKQYLIKMACVAAEGILAGTLLTSLCGNGIANAALSMAGLGISKVSFVIDPVVSYVITPAALLAIVLFSTWSASKLTKQQSLISMINE